MRYAWLGFFISLSVSAAQQVIPPSYTGPVTDPAEICMVKNTVQTQTSYTSTYKGKTYHFCCTMCLGKFQADPEHLRWAVDPITHKPVDRADAFIYSLNGHAIYFASKRHLQKFAKHPDRYKPA